MINIELYELVVGWVAVTKNDLGEATACYALTMNGAYNRLHRKLNRKYR